MNIRENSENKGIIITGGTVKADQIVAGDNAKAQKIIKTAQNNNTKKTLDDLREELSNLLELVKENRNELHPSTEGALQVVQQEAEKENPNKVVMTSVLDGILTGVQSIDSITKAVTAIKSLIAIIL